MTSPDFPCCGRKPYANPLFLEPENARFGQWPTCPNCSKLLGDPKIDYLFREKWNAYSVVATREFYKSGERPLRFVVAKQGIVPAGWKPAQVELAEVEEPPF